VDEVMKKLLGKGALFSGIFFISSQLFALGLTCPNPSEFVMHAQLPPVSYNVESNQVSTIGLSLSANPITGEKWLMVINPIKFHPENFNMSVVEDTITKLSKVSNTAFETKVYTDLDTLHYCLYMQADQKELSAIAYLIDISPSNEFDTLNLNQPKIKKLLNNVLK
jgi:hypothetical protein